MSGERCEDGPAAVGFAPSGPLEVMNRTSDHKDGIHASRMLVACMATGLLFAGLVGQASAGRLDRYEQRSAEMALPDPELDPFADRALGPAPGAFTERIPDSVDHAPLDEEAMDAAEREEYERYLVEQGVAADPYDHLGRDAWDGGSGPDTDRTEGGGYADPAEW